MVKVVWFRFQQFLIPLTMLLVEGRVKRDYLDIYLTAFLEVCNFGNASARGYSLFLKYSKLHPDFKKTETNLENFFSF